MRDILGAKSIEVDEWLHVGIGGEVKNILGFLS